MKVIPKDNVIEDVKHTIKIHNPARQSLLRILGGRDFKVGVEIGVQYGLGAEVLLQAVEKLYGIDPYKSETGIVSAIKDKKRDGDIYGFALGKLHQFGDRYTHIRKTSLDGMLDVPGEVDCIYLDGDKRKKTFWDDLTFWYPKVREGGIIIGHDYNHSSYPHIKRLVDMYFKPMGVKVGVEEGSVWWVEKKGIRNDKKISVVTPYYNTARYIENVIDLIVKDDRIDEMIVIDDASDPEECNQMVEAISSHVKIRNYRNKGNLGELKSRIRGAKLANNEWVIFLDSDNSLTKEYVDSIYKIPLWKERVIYCPEYGNHKAIDYRSLTGNYIHKDNISSLLSRNERTVRMFLNTGNYFMNRANYLKTAKKCENFDKSKYGDIVLNNEWLEDGGYFFIVNGMHYTHRIRKDSMWRLHSGEMQPVVDEIIDKLK